MATKRSRRFALGKKSKAFDARTGRKVNYRDLRREWTGHWVHKDEWEPKHPQLRPKSATDAQALHHPRPSYEDATSVRRGSISGIQSFGYIGDTYPAMAVDGVEATGSATSVIFNQTINETGVEATGALGNSTYSAIDVPDGVEATGTISTSIPGGWGMGGWGDHLWGDMA